MTIVYYKLNIVIAYRSSVSYCINYKSLIVSYLNSPVYILPINTMNAPNSFLIVSHQKHYFIYQGLICHVYTAMKFILVIVYDFSHST